MRAELRSDVMGSRAHVVVTGDDALALAEHGKERLVELEHRWSRFIPDSEISLVNDAAPNPVVVSAETCALVERAVRGWHMTNGRFDPTVLGDVIRAGYDRSFRDLAAATHAGTSDRRRGCAGIVADERTNLVQLPDRVGFDPGGIGKGFAADLVVDELMARGAAGACVNVGGDIRVAGLAPTGGSWSIDVLDPLSDEIVDVVVVDAGAIATSSRAKRQWSVDGRAVHHLVDPSTGKPATSCIVAVTALAGTAWRAEVATKAAFVGGPDGGLRFLEEHHIPALLVCVDGIVTTRPWEQFRARAVTQVAS